MTYFNYSLAKDKLSTIGQQSLLDFWPQLTADQQNRLLKQIDQLDLDIFRVLKTAFLKKDLPYAGSFEPFKAYENAGSSQDISLGRQLISEGKCGSLLLAGGQGTRLNFAGPKGMFPVTAIRRKTLFQLFAEKTLAASELAGRPLPLAIMTSPLNDEETKNYFFSNRNFGLSEKQLYFFSQKMSPLFNEQGNLFLDPQGSLAEGPDGNGSSLHYFVQDGIWKAWQDAGIKLVNYVLVDNPLADPFDANLLGFHARQNNEITIKCCMRRDKEEKVGVVVQDQHRAKVVEYSEMPEKERYAAVPDGSLRHLCANLSLFCFSMESIKALAEKYGEMPFHLAYKSVNGNKSDSSPLMAWKGEKFIFDILPFARKVKALAYPREACFSPLKNAKGVDSPVTVAEALQQRDREIWKEITGKESAENPFELAQQFYYPSLQLMRKWRGSTMLPKGYIEP